MAASVDESAVAWLGSRGPLDVHVGHIFDNITISGNARAIFGDVQVSCPEISTQMSLVQSRRTFLNVLFYQNMQKRFTQIQTARSATCDWIWKTSFRDWLSSSTCSEVFWISGKPGSGKSTLMKYLAASSKTRSLLPVTKARSKSWTVSNFFFDFRASKELSNTDEGLLRSLLHQIVTELPIESSVLQKHEISLGYTVAAGNIDHMISVVADVISKEEMNVLLLVDGLDEYEDNARGLIQLLQRLQAETGLRLCLASRPEPTIKAMLAKSPTIEVQEYNSVGIEAYVRHSISEIRDSLALGQTSWIEQTVAHILQKADGVFLWIQFATNVLLEHIVLGDSESEVYADLKTLPTELDGMYDRVINRIPQGCRSEAFMILLLVNNAGQFVTLGRLLAVWQYFHALLGTGPLNYQALTYTQFELRLRGLFGGLLDLQSSSSISVSTTNTEFSEADTIHVRLVHETLRAYMQGYAQIDKYLDARIKTDYSANTWLKVYIEVISKVIEILPRNHILEIIDGTMDVYKSERLKNNEPWRASRIHVLKQLEIAHTKLTFSDMDTNSDQQSWPVLPYALLQVYDLFKVEHKDIISSKHSELFFEILNSPILLLYDLIQAEKLQIGLAIRNRPAHWSYDLAIAAGRGWLPYSPAVWMQKIQEISETERNVLIVCLTNQSATFAPTLSSSIASFRTLYLSQSDRFLLIESLVKNQFLRNFHLIFFMQEVFWEDTAKLIPIVKSRWLSQGKAPDLVPSEYENRLWEKLYGSYSTRNSKWENSLEALASLLCGMSAGVFQRWISLLTELQFDLLSWRDVNGFDLLDKLHKGSCDSPDEVKIVHGLHKILSLIDIIPYFRERISARVMLVKLYLRLNETLQNVLLARDKVFVDSITLEDLLEEDHARVGPEDQYAQSTVRLCLEIMKRLRRIWPRLIQTNGSVFNPQIELLDLKERLEQWRVLLVDFGKREKSGDIQYEVDLVKGQLEFLDADSKPHSLRKPKRKRVSVGK